ncbi:DUF7169 domain-containing protein [Nocardiopsis alba]|uniref:DUF7169 domain-containing protein n=1 Tax=Nocardiopsis alba TaxID=53437 RepID=UPI003D73D9E1
MTSTLTEVTRRAARTAVLLHRLALAAEEAATLKSPATPARPVGGIARPTEDVVLCPRRAQVRETLDDVTPELAAALARISHALEVWEGRA